MTVPLDEFAIIKSFFTQSHYRNDVVLGIGDDCAILRVPPDKELLVSTDTLLLNRHFLPITTPFEIGYRCAAVSLSDMAAMGGDPSWLLLSLTLPEPDEKWLADFSAGLFKILKEYHVDLVGGNTTRGFLSVTTQIMGFASAGKALRRFGAQVGDDIYVTHTLGNAALALAILKHEIDAALFDIEEIKKLNASLWYPTPRIKEAAAIASLASAAIDISDGLLADLTHILKTNQVGAELELNKIPISKSLEKLSKRKRYELALSAGDDYELCFTLSPQNKMKIEKLNQKGFSYTCIGRITEVQDLIILDEENKKWPFVWKGYQHF